MDFWVLCSPVQFQSKSTCGLDFGHKIWFSSGNQCSHLLALFTTLAWQEEWVEDWRKRKQVYAENKYMWYLPSLSANVLLLPLACRVSQVILISGCVCRILRHFWVVFHIFCKAFVAFMTFIITIYTLFCCIFAF